MHLFIKQTAKLSLNDTHKVRYSYYSHTNQNLNVLPGANKGVHESLWSIMGSVFGASNSSLERPTVVIVGHNSQNEGLGLDSHFSMVSNDSQQGSSDLNLGPYPFLILKIT